MASTTLVIVLCLIIGGLVMMGKCEWAGVGILKTVVWWIGLIFLLAGVLIALVKPLAWLARQVSEMVV